MKYTTSILIPRLLKVSLFPFCKLNTFLYCVHLQWRCIYRYGNANVLRYRDHRHNSIKNFHCDIWDKMRMPLTNINFFSCLIQGTPGISCVTSPLEFQHLCKWYYLTTYSIILKKNNLK